MEWPPLPYDDGDDDNIKQYADGGGGDDDESGDQKFPPLSLPATSLWQ